MMKPAMIAAVLSALGAGMAEASTLAFRGNADFDTGIPQFDPALGTLNSATFQLEGDGATGGGILCPDDQYSETIDGRLLVDFLDETYGELNTFTFNCTVAGEIFEWNAPVLFDVTRSFSGTELAPLIGLGEVPVTRTQGADLSYGWVFYSVSYAFTPAAVPLPGAGGMLAAGLFGIAALRRRKINGS